MTKTALTGALVTFGNRRPLGESGTTNPDLGPNAFVGGSSFFDQRGGYNANRTGWLSIGTEYLRCLSQAPAALAAAGLAAAQHTTSGTGLTLAGASTGITVVPTGGVTVWPSGNLIPAGALVLDGLPAIVNYGQPNSSGNYSNCAYSNGAAIARAVSVLGVTAGAGGNVVVSGYDIYGYPMTETIAAAAGAGTTNGKKAFKFIVSVVPAFTDAHNYSVGTTDIFGLPMRADFFHEAMIWWNSALITANTGFVAADTTSPATSTTGDVRGTYAVQSASDGTKRLAVAVGPPQSTIATNAGVFGVTQA